MSKPNIGDGSFVGVCMSCKERKLLQDFNGIKLCHKCEDLFYEDLIKKHEQEQFGKDIFNDQKKKQED